MTSHPKTPLHLNDSTRSVHFTKHLSDLPPVISPEQAEADRVYFMEMAAREQAEREADNRRTYFRENYAKNRERRRKYQREYKRKRRAEGKDKKPVLTSPRTDAHRFTPEDREWQAQEIHRLRGEGVCDEEIAAQLGISTRTLERRVAVFQMKEAA